MGLYIKDIGMPKSCADCSCASIFAGYKCMACDRQFDKYPLENKMDWCPLIPVPPHGKLIDMDVLCDCFYKDYFRFDAEAIVDYIRTNVPTIIPAEEHEI